MTDDFRDFVKFDGFAGQVWYHQMIRDKRILRRAREFTPERLLEKGEQGVWYDPSDTTTLFQDSAGTTPVTASGQPVGLMLDKSKGLVRGPELVVNGGFSSGLTGWMQSTAGYWSVVGGRAYHAPTGEYRDIRQSLSTLAGKWVEITYDIEVLQGSTVSGVTGTTTILGVGAYSVRLFALLPASPVFFASRQATGVATEIYIDNISVRELPGNHATQPTAGSRPIYRRGDSRGVVNLLTWSEAFNDASWGSSASVVKTGNTQVIGGITYHEINYTSATGGALTKATTYSGPTAFSVYAFAGTKSEISLRHGGAGPQVGVVLSGTPTRFTATQNVSDSTVVFQNNTGQGSGTIWLGNAQLNLGPTALPYQRNDANLGGVATGASTDLHWLETDGVDDGMVTGNINFTGTGKVSVFAGVRKLSDATTGVVVELSNNGAGNSGGLGLLAPNFTAEASYGFRSNQGTPASVAARGLASPRSDVLTAMSEVGVPIKLGVSGAENTGHLAGTGNFGNYPLYLFRRGGTSLPFNGWFYGLAITGRLTTDAETVATERFLAAKSAVVIP